MGVCLHAVHNLLGDSQWGYFGVIYGMLLGDPQGNFLAAMVKKQNKSAIEALYKVYGVDL